MGSSQIFLSVVVLVLEGVIILCIQDSTYVDIQVCITLKIIICQHERQQQLIDEPRFVTKHEWFCFQIWDPSFPCRWRIPSFFSIISVDYLYCVNVIGVATIIIHNSYKVVANVALLPIALGIRFLGWHHCCYVEHNLVK